MAQERIFVDATHWIALLYPKDNNQDLARAVDKKISGASIWTTELILIEILDFFCQKGDHLRKVAANAVDAVRRHKSVTVVPLDITKFESALVEFKRYHDKGWSITDCSSFIVMRQCNITTACAYDAHFEQAQFSVLR